MAQFSLAMVVGAALLDSGFARALLADPRHALASYGFQLAGEDMSPFFAGATSVAELARVVYEWEIATHRAESPLRVPALEPRPAVVEPKLGSTDTSPRRSALAA